MGEHMSDKPAVSASQWDAISLALTVSQAALTEVRAQGKLDGLAKYAPEFLEKFVEPLIKSRTRPHEERIRAIEQRRLLEDAGTWNKNSEYFCGQVAQHDGSAWTCQRDNTSRDQPGKSDSWKLLVKRGNDASVGGIERRLAALEQELAALKQKLGDA